MVKLEFEICDLLCENMVPNDVYIIFSYNCMQSLVFGKIMVGWWFNITDVNLTI